MRCATPVASTQVSLDHAHQEPELITVRHRVEPGQTLYRIARAYGLEPEDLAAANGISDPRTLSVGMELVIPGAGEVRPVPPPGKDDAEDPPPAPKPKQASRPPAPGTVHTPQKAGALDWPLRGVLYARFGKKGKEPHDGIDLAAPLGTPVRTAAPGSVLFAGEQHGYGLLVIVDHGGGLITLYAHNRDLRVKAGQKVRAGQVVATVGESGKTSGPHLHFEVRKGGVPVDPLDYLGPVPPR